MKKQICELLKTALDLKVGNTLASIRSLKESRDTNTKSSAGDKYETGRAMLQIELDNSEAQLAKLIATRNELERINTDRSYEKAETGSLVFTSQGTYFLSIGFGKVDIVGGSFFCVSSASPIGAALKNTSAGEKIFFQGKEIDISRVA